MCFYSIYVQPLLLQFSILSVCVTYALLFC